MDAHEEIRASAEYARAAIDAGALRDVHAIWGDDALKQALERMGPDRAAKACVVLGI